jgi:hypothetical protein
MRRCRPLLAVLIHLLLPAVFSIHSETLGQDFRSAPGNRRASLRSLPPIQALPIDATGSTTGLAQGALSSPAYCDSGTLRDSATIRAIRFWDRTAGIAVGDHGMILASQDGGQSWTPSRGAVECQLNDVIWYDALRVIAVGGGIDPVTRISRGVVLVSSDAGQTWRRSNDSDLPRMRVIQTGPKAAAAGRQRMRSITAHGDADPVSGATTFETRDAGRSWQAVLDPPGSSPTGGFNAASQAALSDKATTADLAAQWSRLTNAHAVIRTSCRVNEQTVLCAGDHGSILRSTDGGKTWKAVHGGNSSSALLVIARGREQIPWSLIGRETLEKRLRANIVVGVTDRETGDSLMTDGVAQAAMQLGAAALDTYPRTDPTESVRSLKHWIDVHHPPIIALDAELDPDLKTVLLQHAVAGGTTKVVEYSRVRRGESLLHHSATLPSCGVLAGDFERDCQMLFTDFEMPSASMPSNPWTSIDTRYSGGNQLTRGDSLGVGVHLISRHRLPRRVSNASRRRLQVIQGRLKQQVAIAELFRARNQMSPPVPDDRFADAMRVMLDQTSRTDQFRSAWSIAEQSIGNPDQTLVWDEIANRFTDSTAARLAGLHAQARRASVEWRQHETQLLGPKHHVARLKTSDPIAAQVAGYEANDDPASELLPSGGGHAAIVSPFQTQPHPDFQSQHGVVQASALFPIGNRRGSDTRHQAKTPAPSDIDLTWQMHPVRLIVASAIARNRQQTETESTPESQAETLSADLRRIAARQTPWSNLLKPASRQSTIGLRTDSRPRLDGILDDPVWNNADVKPAQTRDASGIRLHVAWDTQFIYIATRIPADRVRSEGQSETAGDRDADLTSVDRITLALDVDRDLLTSMSIAFTPDGQTHDALDGFAGWNPTWYVASHLSEDWVTTEIAIEQTGLGVAVEPGDSWFIEAETIAAGQPQRFRMMPAPANRLRVDFR